MATLTTPHPFPILGNSTTEQLADRLRKTTSAEVRFTPGDRALYASDLSHYRQVPMGVVVPRTLNDVIATVAACREFDLPLFGRGAGTSLSGQTTNAGVVLDFSKHLNAIEELNAHKRYAWVQPGLINDDLRATAEQHNLTFAPDPATHSYCTLGGMIGNNSCGPHSVLGGKTSENIDELDILLYDGTRMTSVPPPNPNSNASSKPAVAKARSTPPSATSGTNTPPSSAPGTPGSPAASAATTSTTSFPKTAFT